jgi:hypothetical protein
VRHYRAPVIILIAALTLAALAVGTALAAHSVTFKASYAGKATEKVSGQTVTDSVRGTGLGTLVGRGTITGTVTASTANPPCSPFGGPGLIAGKGGKLKVTVLKTSRGCAAGEDDQNNISFSGTAKVIGGTGKLIKARGTLRFTGHYDRSGGAFTVKLKGTLTY